MSDKKLISIIVPIYNTERYLTECLESIRAQTYPDFECLLVDDGSTDDSGKICDLFREKDSRFKVFHNSNHGVSYSRNYGIQNAKGYYLTFIDSDDVVDPEMLEKLTSGVEQSEADICFCKFDTFDEKVKKTTL